MQRHENQNNSELPNSVNPDFINFLNEKVAEHKAFDDLIASNYAEQSVATENDRESRESHASPKERLRAGLFAAAAIISVYQMYDQTTEAHPSLASIPVATAEVSSEYTDGEITSDSYDTDREVTHPIQMTTEDLMDITKPIELKPEQARNNHHGRQWLKSKRKYQPRILRSIAH